MSPTTIFAPASTAAAAIFDLSVLVIAVTAGIFVVVCALLVDAVVAFRKRPNDDGAGSEIAILPLADVGPADMVDEGTDCAVRMLGELAASLAHEIKQPIAAALIDAKVCLRALADNRLDLEAAREAASRLLKDARWADEII